MMKKAFREFIRKEVFHILRDYRTLLVLIGMPVAQVILFGFAIRTEINEARIGILDYSKDNVTTEITNKLLSSGYFSITAYLQSDSGIEQLLASGKAEEVIVFQPDFAKKLAGEGKASIQIINDASNPNLASLINTYTQSIIMDYQNELAKNGKTASFILDPEIKMLFNPDLKSVNMFVPGLIAFIMMLVSALMTSIAITREKELGTMEVLLVSPLKPPLIIIGKVLPYLVIAITNVMTIILIALTVFEIPFRGSVLLFAGESMLFISTALSLGILISTIAQTQQVAMMMSLAGLLMPTMLLSGFIFPVENMPVFLQWVSNIVPAKWFLIIIKDILLKGVGIEYFWKETLILFGMTMIFLAASVKNFKIRLE